MTVSMKLVYARTRRMVSGEHDIDDIVQEVLLRAFSGMKRLKNYDSYLPWLRRITDNVIIDHIECRQKRRAQSYPVELIRDERRGPEESVVDRDLIDRIGKSIQHIKPRSRLVVELFYFRGLSCREVAEFLNISHDATRAVLSRARYEIRSMIMDDVKATEKTDKKKPFRMSTTGGSRIDGAGPVYVHNSPEDKLYRALYPSNSFDTAVARSELTRSAAEKALAKLTELRLVEPRGSEFRCTAPVVNATDIELILPWARLAAKPVLDRLDDAYRQAVELSASCATDAARSTVLLFALLSIPLRAFQPIYREMDSSEPYRGKYGWFRVTNFLAEIPGGMPLTGGYGFSTTGRTGSFWAWPHGTARPRIQRLMRKIKSWDNHRSISIEGILRQTSWIGPGSMSEGAVKLIATSLGIRGENVDEFYSELVEARLITTDGKLNPGIPVLPWDRWTEYVSSLEEIGAEVSRVVCDASDDLRRRASLSSFKDCNFDDSIEVFFTLARALVSQAIAGLERGTQPVEAAFEWGVMFVRDNANPPILYSIDAITRTDEAGARDGEEQQTYIVTPGNSNRDFNSGMSIRLHEIIVTRKTRRRQGIEIKGNLVYEGSIDEGFPLLRLIIDGVEHESPVPVEANEQDFRLNAHYSHTDSETGNGFPTSRLPGITIDVELADGTRGVVVELLPS